MATQKHFVGMFGPLLIFDQLNYAFIAMKHNLAQVEVITLFSFFIKQSNSQSRCASIVSFVPLVLENTHMTIKFQTIRKNKIAMKVNKGRLNTSSTCSCLTGSACFHREDKAIYISL